MLWYYDVILMPLIVGIVLVLVLVLEATVLEISLRTTLCWEDGKATTALTAALKETQNY